MTNIFIANLDWEISSEDLHATFSAFGKVSYAHVVFDRVTKKSKGYGYVEMDNAEEAIVAIEALKGLEVNGRKLDVKIASPKGSRPEKQEAVNLQNKKFSKPFNKNRGGGGGGHRSGGGGGYRSGGGHSNHGGQGGNGGHGGGQRRPRISGQGNNNSSRD
ncbi:MAG: RNA-binding protein [Crocinitomicaceae bacterium]|jgi:RNA recognition motif-containing protein|nr:RNA-binding protein [Crocinitomicaceae bacterium]